MRTRKPFLRRFPTFLPVLAASLAGVGCGGGDRPTTDAGMTGDGAVATDMSLGPVGDAAAAADGNTTDGGSGTDVATCDPQCLAERIAQQARALVANAGGAADWVEVKGDTLPVIADGSTMMPRNALPSPLPSPLAGAMADSPGWKSLTRRRLPSLLSRAEAFDETAEDVRAFLAERVLTAANREGEVDGETIYLLKPESTCRPLPSAIAGGTAPDPDPECVADLPKLQLRVGMRPDGDGARLRVLVGPDRIEWSVFTVHSDLLAWEASLPSFVSATVYISTTLGETEIPVFEKAAGKLRVALQGKGKDKVSVEASVLEALEIQTKDPFYFRTERRVPALVMALDGTSKEGNFKIDVGATTVKVPWDPRDTGAKNLDLVVEAGGVGLEGVVKPGATMQTFAANLQPFSVAVRGMKIVEGKLNPTDGGRLTASVTAPAMATQPSRWEVLPRVDFTLDMQLGKVAAELDEAPEPAVADETYTIKLEPKGVAPGLGAVIEDVPSTDTRPSALRIVRGELTVSARTSPESTLVVPAGTCLVDRDVVPAGAHSVLGEFEVATCP